MGNTASGKDSASILIQVGSWKLGFYKGAHPVPWQRGQSGSSSGRVFSWLVMTLVERVLGCERQVCWGEKRGPRTPTPVWMHPDFEPWTSFPTLVFLLCPQEGHSCLLPCQEVLSPVLYAFTPAVSQVAPSGETIQGATLRPYATETRPSSPPCIGGASPSGKNLREPPNEEFFLGFLHIMMEMGV